MKKKRDIAFMKEGDLIKYIKGLNKPYQGIMPQSTFSSIMIRYEAGLAKPITIKKFLIRMGYIFENEWKKK